MLTALLELVASARTGAAAAAANRGMEAEADFEADAVARLRVGVRALMAKTVAELATTHCSEVVQKLHEEGQFGDPEYRFVENTLSTALMRAEELRARSLERMDEADGGAWSSSSIREGGSPGGISDKSSPSAGLSFSPTGFSRAGDESSGARRAERAENLLRRLELVAVEEDPPASPGGGTAPSAPALPRDLVTLIRESFRPASEDYLLQHQARFRDQCEDVAKDLETHLGAIFPPSSTQECDRSTTTSTKTAQRAAGMCVLRTQALASSGNELIRVVLAERQNSVGNFEQLCHWVLDYLSRVEADQSRSRERDQSDFLRAQTLQLQLRDQQLSEMNEKLEQAKTALEKESTEKRDYTRKMGAKEEEWTRRELELVTGWKGMETELEGWKERWNSEQTKRDVAAKQQMAIIGEQAENALKQTAETYEKKLHTLEKTLHATRVKLEEGLRIVGVGVPASPPPRSPSASPAASQISWALTSKESQSGGLSPGVVQEGTYVVRRSKL